MLRPSRFYNIMVLLTIVAKKPLWGASINVFYSILFRRAVSIFYNISGGAGFSLTFAEEIVVYFINKNTSL